MYDRSLVQEAHSSSRLKMNITDRVSPGLRPNSRNQHLHSENRFRFTPIKNVKSAPRLWDRKLSTPLAARGPVPRKLWKRVQPSLKMKTSRGSLGTVNDNQDELNTEINDARNDDYLRGVKRRCVRLHDGDGQDGGALFLESQWELEISMKRRKLPAGRTELFGGPSATVNANKERDTASTAVARKLTLEQESRLVRSALRSSLDGEDAAVLNNFLSKAQAKRAAKATATQDAESKASQESSEIGCHTPQRKALDKLDANSPSPTKTQLSPYKASGPENSTALTELESKGETDNDHQQASPVTSRSTRARQQPAVRNTFLRRAKGTEFIFRARTEEQEIEVKTRVNTLYNKGDALLPKAALKAMANQLTGEPSPSDEDVVESKNELLEGEPTLKMARKHVSWRKARFVEYDSGSYHDYFSDSSGSDIPAEKATAKRTRKNEAANMGSKRSSHSARLARQGSKEGEKNAAETPNTKKVRRVRKLGSRTTSIPTDITIDVPGTPTDESAVYNRKKLKPTSPEVALLAAPASKMLTGTHLSSSHSGHSTSNSKRTHTADAGLTPKPKRVRAKS